MSNDTNFEEAGAFLKKHWPYVIVGGVAIVGILWTMRSTAGTAATVAPVPTVATTPAVDPSQTVAGYTAALQASVAARQSSDQLNAALIAGQAQTAIAGMQAQAIVDQANIFANQGAYDATVAAQSSTANYMAATSAAQSIQAMQMMTTGFSNYAASIASTAAIDATTAAGVVQSNNSTASRTLGAALSGAAMFASALVKGPTGLSVLAQPFTAGYSNLLPNITTATPIPPNYTLPASAMATNGLLGRA